MAALEAAALSVLSASSSPSSKFLSPPKPCASLKLNLSYSAPSLSFNLPFSPLRLNNPTRKPGFSLLCSAVQEAATAEEDAPEESEELILKKKLFLYNLPFALTPEDLKTLFSECGNVVKAEIVTQRNGKSRGFGFVTMSTSEEAQAAVAKFDNHEVLGRVIRVEIAKRVKKPSPSPVDEPAVETRHILYVSNLAWKVRANNLREFFTAADFNPVSARVIFETTTGRRSAGYGFVSFATREEADAAVSALNGKLLMDRPIQMKISEPKVGESKSEEEDVPEGQPSKSEEGDVPESQPSKSEEEDVPESQPSES